MKRSFSFKQPDNYGIYRLRNYQFLSNVKHAFSHLSLSRNNILLILWIFFSTLKLWDYTKGKVCLDSYDKVFCSFCTYWKDVLCKSQLNKNYYICLFTSEYSIRQNYLGPSIKDICTKFQKIDHPPCPQKVRTGLTPLTVGTYHKFLKIRRFFTPKSAGVRIWKPFPKNAQTGQTPFPSWMWPLLPFCRETVWLCIER